MKDITSFKVGRNVEILWMHLSVREVAEIKSYQVNQNWMQWMKEITSFRLGKNVKIIDAFVESRDCSNVLDKDFNFINEVKNGCS